MMNINNVPAYAENMKYIVARRVNGQYWFWGAWNDRDRANEVAIEVGCVVFCNEQKKGWALHPWSLTWGWSVFYIFITTDIFLP